MGFKQYSPPAKAMLAVNNIIHLSCIDLTSKPKSKFRNTNIIILSNAKSPNTTKYFIMIFPSRSCFILKLLSFFMNHEYVGKDNNIYLIFSFIIGEKLLFL